jgi:hypothetical protein
VADVSHDPSHDGRLVVVLHFPPKPRRFGAEMLSDRNDDMWTGRQARSTRSSIKMESFLKRRGAGSTSSSSTSWRMGRLRTRWSGAIDLC